MEFLKELKKGPNQSWMLDWTARTHRSDVRAKKKTTGTGQQTIVRYMALAKRVLLSGWRWLPTGRLQQISAQMPVLRLF